MTKIRECVDGGADINDLFFNGYSDDDTLSIIASSSSYENRLRNIRLCIGMGSRLDAKRHSYAWLTIIRGGNIEEVGRLLDQYPAMLNTRFFGAGQDGLCAALINNDVAMTRFLLSRGANPNQYTGWYPSTLHRAEHIIETQREEIECATLIRNCEFAILLIKAAKFGACSSGECVTNEARIAQQTATQLPSDLQIELASYFW